MKYILTLYHLLWQSYHEAEEAIYERAYDHHRRRANHHFNKGMKWSLQ